MSVIRVMITIPEHQQTIPLNPSIKLCKCLHRCPRVEVFFFVEEGFFRLLQSGSWLIFVVVKVPHVRFQIMETHRYQDQL